MPGGAIHTGSSRPRATVLLTGLKGGTVRAVHHVGRTVGVLAFAAGVLVVGPLSGVSGASSTPTGTPIKIGYIADQTGTQASSGAGSQLGAQAYITAINKEGGYHGHPLQLISVDSASTASGAASAVNLLISDGVFAIITNTPFFFAGYQAAYKAGIPVIGATTDGPEWGQQPYTNMFNLRGGMNAAHVGLADIGSIPFLKSIGVKTVAGLAIGASPSSKQTIVDYKTAGALHGISMPYENLTLPFTPFDVTPLVLQVKDSGVQAVVCSCGISTYLNLITGLKQEGVHIKALVFGSVDTSLTASAAAEAASQGVYLFSGLPALNSSASLVFEHRLKAVDPAYKVGTYTKFDTGNAYFGVGLIDKGLQLTGKADPTTQEFISHLSKLKNWTADGLFANPVSYDHFGTSEPKYCEWVVQVKGKDFKMTNDGKQYCLATPASLK